MPPLTWRNVDAPQAGDALQGLSLANRAIGGAGDSLSEALGKFGNYQTLQANNAVEQAALRVQDPTQLASALSSGSLLQGIDPTKISAGVLQGLQSRVGDLLNQQVVGENLSKDQYGFARQKTNDTNVDAATPLLNALSTAAAANDQKTVTGLLADPKNTALLSSIHPQQVQDALGGNQRLAGGDIANQSSFFNFGKGVRDDTEGRDVSAAAAEINDAALGDPARAYSLLNARKGSMSPAAFAALSGSVEHLVPGTIGNLNTLSTQAASGLPVAGAISDVGTAGTSKGSPFDATHGNISTGSVGVSQMPIGDLTKDGGISDMLLKATGASPIGAYQINKDTLKQYAPQVFGKDAATTPFTPQNQDKLAQAIFDDRKQSGKMTDTWPTLAGVPGADKPGGMKNVSWNDVRDQIAQKESGADPIALHQSLNNLANINQTTQQTTAARSSEDLANNVDPKKWESATQETGSTTAEVGTKLAAEKGGALEGTNPNWITNRLDEIREQSNNQLNAAQAGEILRSSLKGGAEGFVRRFIQNHVGFSDKDAGTANNQVIDLNKVKTLIDDAQSGRTVTQGVQANVLSQQNQALQNAQAVVTAAAQRYQGAQRAVQQGRLTADDLATYKKNYDTSNLQYQMLLHGAAINQESTPTDWQKNRNTLPPPPAPTVNADNATDAFSKALQDPKYTVM